MGTKGHKCREAFTIEESGNPGNRRDPTLSKPKAGLPGAPEIARDRSVIAVIGKA